MPFIGNQPALSYTSFAKQDFSTSATTSYTLDNPVANANELALFINFVRQEPTTAYSASGTTLTLTSATSSSDDMYCVYLGKAVQTVNPPNASVGTSQLVDGAVTKDKVSNLMYPAFGASVASIQSITASTFTKIQFDNEIFDTNNAYDNSTNYRFTIPSGQAGKYYITLDYVVQSNSNDQIYNILGIYKNGTIFKRSDMNTNSTANAQFRRFPASSYTIADLNVGDYIEAFAYVSATSPFIDGDSTEARSFFGAFRIGD